MHVGCLRQAQTSGRVVTIPVTTGEPVGVVGCVLGTEFRADWEEYKRTEVELRAQRSFDVGLRLFPQVAPSRQLEDLLDCIANENSGERFAESTVPLDVSGKFPRIREELMNAVPRFSMPGGTVDVLAKNERNTANGGASAFKMTFAQPGAARRARVSKYRSCTMLLAHGSRLDWGVLSPADAEHVLEASRNDRSKHDSSFIPDASYCLRAGATIYCGMQTEFASTMISQTGSLSWFFVRGPKAGDYVEWNFADRSLAAFRFALASPNRGEDDLNTTDADDVLHMDTMLSILRDERERNTLLPRNLVKTMTECLAKLCEADLTPNGVPKITKVDAPPAFERCTHCECELFYRAVVCSPCVKHSIEAKSIIKLEASHPNRPSSKKDRSILPDWLRLGCRVLVNLTVVGNSNDRPPRVVGASHSPGILLKTGHGFFTIYLEGTAETVVKRRAAIEPHPSGPGLPLGFEVVIKCTEGEDKLLIPNFEVFKSSFFCVPCYKSTHAHRNDHAAGAAKFVDLRKSIGEEIKSWGVGGNRSRGDGGGIETTSDSSMVWDLLVVDKATEITTARPEKPRIPTTISRLAGTNAMHAAEIMGPSPCRPVTTILIPIESLTPPPANIFFPPQSPSNAGTSIVAENQSKRRDVTEIPSSEHTPSPEATPPPFSLSQRLRKLEELKSAPMSSSSSSSAFLRKRIKRQSLLSQKELSESDISNDLATTLTTGSFYVGGPRSISISMKSDSELEAMTKSRNADKPEEVQALWARACRDVPLKKIWKFI